MRQVQKSIEVQAMFVKKRVTFEIRDKRFAVYVKPPKRNGYQIIKVRSALRGRVYDPYQHVKDYHYVIPENLQYSDVQNQFEDITKAILRQAQQNRLRRDVCLILIEWYEGHPTTWITNFIRASGS